MYKRNFVENAIFHKVSEIHARSGGSVCYDGKGSIILTSARGMEWRAAVRFQKYFSMVGELNVWWPATRVSLWFSRAILPCGGRLRFTCWLKWRETLVVGVCSLFCVPPRERQTSSRRATTTANLSFTRLHRARSNSTLRARAPVNLGFFYHQRHTYSIAGTYVSLVSLHWVENCDGRKLNYRVRIACEKFQFTKVFVRIKIWYTQRERIVPIKFVFFPRKRDRSFAINAQLLH